MHGYALVYTSRYAYRKYKSAISQKTQKRYTYKIRTNTYKIHTNTHTSYNCHVLLLICVGCSEVAVFVMGGGEVGLDLSTNAFTPTIKG